MAVVISMSVYLICLFVLMLIVWISSVCVASSFLLLMSSSVKISVSVYLVLF